MYSLLVAVIFLSFISLGLPDSLLGSAWPILHLEINTSLANAGIISMIMSMGTIVSALLSNRLINRFGTKKVVFICVLDTAIAMALFSFANSFLALCLIAIPYGLGAGSIDAALNNYVALHMKAKHMSWLHCMWGIGATISPCIMSFAISALDSWRFGYQIVGVLQIIIAIIIFISFPLWDKAESEEKEEDKQIVLSLFDVIKLKGAKSMLLGFMSYCALETTAFLWSSSYFADHFMCGVEKAAILGCLYYAGLMISRALEGFVADKYSDMIQIKVGSMVIIVVGLFTFIMNNYYISIIGLFMLGMGSGPIYPSFIHSTPISYDRSYSQSIIGVQMACAYIGTIVAPYIFGLIAEYIDIVYLPLIMMILAIGVYVLSKIYFNKDNN